MLSILRVARVGLATRLFTRIPISPVLPILATQPVTRSFSVSPIRAFPTKAKPRSKTAATSKKRAATKKKPAAKKPAKRRVALKKKKPAVNRRTRKKKPVAKPIKLKLSDYPQPPKRPTNAFGLWWQAQEFPKGKTHADIKATVKDIARRWQALPQVEKQTYHDRAKAALDKWRVQFTTWAENQDPYILGRFNRLRKSKGGLAIRIRGELNKRPLSAFFLYVKDINHSGAIGQGEPAGLARRDAFKWRARHAGELWRGLAQPDKAKYLSLARKEMAAFKSAHPIPPPIVPKTVAARKSKS